MTDVNPKAGGGSTAGSDHIPPGGVLTPQQKSTLSGWQAEFPWLSQIGLTPAFFQDLVAGSAGEGDMLAKIRQTPQYHQRFQGLTRADGTLRMNEAQYINQEDAYRQQLKQYGYGDEYTKPEALIGFFENEIDPNELKDRLSTYKAIKDGSQATRDAFYVYAGMNVSTDDLFEAVVDPAKGQHLQDEYNATVASQAFDYQTFIGRATALGLSRVSDKLADLQRSGALTGQAVQTLRNTDPAFAQSIIDVLYHGGDPTNTNTLDLQSLLSSFEYAAIGAAATGAGLVMPDKTRVAELRAAGVDRAKATQGYDQFAAQKGIYSGASERIGGQFDQQAFEDVSFLGDAAKASKLQQAMAQETAAGQQQGGFGFSQSKRGGFAQEGTKSAQ